MSVVVYNNKCPGRETLEKIPRGASIDENTTFGEAPLNFGLVCLKSPLAR